MKILIVEDDIALSKGISMALKQTGYEFVQCATIVSARERLLEELFDLILLDVGLPDGSGLDLCQEIRQCSCVPILFITANDMEYDEVAGLEAGADDYITKPFSLAVLRARIASVMRRFENKTDDKLQINDMIFDFDNMVFMKAGRELVLSKTEQKLLRILVLNRGTTVSREILLDKIWSDSAAFVFENALSVSIRRLRNKLEVDPKNPKYIQTVYGIGYTWERT